MGRARIFFLFLADVLCVTFAWLVVVRTYKFFCPDSFHSSLYLKAWPMLLLYTGFNYFSRTYRIRNTYSLRPIDGVGEFKVLFLSAIGAHILALAILGAIHTTAEVSLTVVMVSGMLTAVLSQPFRELSRRLAATLEKRYMRVTAVYNPDNMEPEARMKLLQFEKSVIDRAMAIVLLVVALPFFAIIPVLIKLTSKGPVFYRAHRLGKFGRPISVWKFRTMYADSDKKLEELLEEFPELRAEYERNFKLKQDPRVTPVGRFLRKTSLDELPQLLNVFTHDLALVGPRPIVEKEIRYYGDKYRLFSSVKPGITGLWQVSGRNEKDYNERVKLDIHYIQNWSPWMDVWIILKTVVVVVSGKGAC